jgi:hypothetical protein
MVIPAGPATATSVDDGWFALAPPPPRTAMHDGDESPTWDASLPCMPRRYTRRRDAYDECDEDECGSMENFDAAMSLPPLLRLTSSASSSYSFAPIRTTDGAAGDGRRSTLPPPPPSLMFPLPPLLVLPPPPMPLLFQRRRLLLVVGRCLCHLAVFPAQNRCSRREFPFSCLATIFSEGGRGRAGRGRGGTGGGGFCSKTCFSHRRRRRKDAKRERASWSLLKRVQIR